MRLNISVFIGVILAVVLSTAVAIAVSDFRFPLGQSVQIRGAYLKTGTGTQTGTDYISDGSANWIGLTAPSISADYNLTLPVDDGTANQVLLTDGSGALSWGTSASGNTGLTAGSVPFILSGGTLTESNANFFWNVTANSQYLRLGAGTSPGDIRFLEGSGGGTNYVDVLAPAALSSNPVWTWPSVTTTGPTAEPTVSGQVASATTAGVQSYVERNLILFSNITQATLAGTAPPDSLFTMAGQGSLTIPVNYLDVGQDLTISAGGRDTTDNDGSETLILKFNIGGKNIYTSPATSLNVASNTLTPWTFQCKLTELTAGGTGTATASGSFGIDPGVVGSATYLPFTTSITSFDTTASNIVTITATWANGDAGPDIVTLDQCIIEAGDDA